MVSGQAKPWVPVMVRVAFGLMWSVDATLKWAPAFTAHLEGYFSTDGQPGWVASYISWCSSVVSHDPRAWAYGLAVAETLVALSLLTGVGFRTVCLGGSMLSLVIWSTAEGFGGPYGPGSTDVGTSIAYVLVFALLWWSDAGSRWHLGLGRARGRAMWSNRQAVAGALGLTAVAALLVSLTALASFGPSPSSTAVTPMDGGQMQMTPGGQDQH